MTTTREVFYGVISQGVAPYFFDMAESKKFFATVDMMRRIPIPIEISDELNLRYNRTVEITLEGESMIITPIPYFCIRCDKKLPANRTTCFCEACLMALQGENDLSALLKKD